MCPRQDRISLDTDLVNGKRVIQYHLFHVDRRGLYPGRAAHLVIMSLSVSDQLLSFLLFSKQNLGKGG